MFARRSTLLAVALLVLALLVTSVEAPAAVAARHGPGRVVLRHDFPDPSFLRVGRQYVAFATGADRHRHGVRIATARSVHGPWRVVGAALHRRPAWVGPDRTGHVDWWAPSVVRVHPSRYVMYYAATRRRTGRHCVGVAVSRHATGPYWSPRRPFLCTPGAQEVIDPYPVRLHGRGAVAYKVRFRNRIQIRLRRTSPNWMRPVGRHYVLASRGSNIEAPALLHRGQRYYLFVSRGSFRNCSYRTEVLRSRHLFSGDWRRVSTLMRTRPGGRCGPGGAEFRRIGRTVLGVFHAWLCPLSRTCRRGATADHRRFRGMLMARLVWRHGIPHVR